jgi:hypothetical protein
MVRRAVHRLDAARLLRLALEHAAPGACLHAAAEEGVTLCAIAQAIGAGLGVPVRSLAKDEARNHFDWLAGFVAMDNPTSSALTREACRMEPEGIRAPGGHEGKRIFLLGGGVTHMFSRPTNEQYHPAGLIFSTLGAILILLICYKLKIHFPAVNPF